MSLYPGWREYGGGALAAPAEPRPHKYGAKAQTIDGQRFDSKLEARRWQELQLRLRAGEIRDLQRQVRIDLHAPGGELVGYYVADFTYLDTAEKRLVIEDAKGVKTALYGWKKRHVLAEHGVQIREITAEPRDRARRRRAPRRRRNRR